MARWRKPRLFTVGKMSSPLVLSIRRLLLPGLFLLWGCEMETGFIFHPTAEIVQTPKEFDLTYEDIYFTTADGVRLNGWYIPSAVEGPTLLWFHGNAGNISHRLHNLRLVHEKLKTHIFIVDYRGYGKSEGQASENGTYQDAQAALQYLQRQKNIDLKYLVIFGRSLGAAVAAHLAAQENAAAVILETPFASIAEMAKVAFPFLPLGPFLKTRYDVLKIIPLAKSPVLVIHGDQDDIVPYAQGRKVFEAAHEPKEFYTIQGASHNDTYLVGGEPYFSVLRNFIRRRTAQSPRN